MTDALGTCTPLNIHMRVSICNGQIHLSTYFFRTSNKHVCTIIMGFPLLYRRILPTCMFFTAILHLFGILHPFSIWTFISLFYLDFYFPFLFGLSYPYQKLFCSFSILLFSIAVTFWISSNFFYQNNNSGFSFLDNYYFYFIRF